MFFVKIGKNALNMQNNLNLRKITKRFTKNMLICTFFR